MKTLFIIIAFSLFSLFKTNDFKLEKTIEVKGDFITTDKLGNIYLVKANNLLKYDSDGKLLKTFSNLNAGNISFVDASDPLKILVFYKDFAQIDFLDNTLSLSGSSIKLSNLKLDQSSLACTSYNNGFWVYDETNIRLVRIDKLLNVSNESTNISQVCGLELNPNFLIEQNNFVYLNDPDNGILVFDRYGTYLKTLPFKNIQSLQIIGNSIVFVQDSILKSYNMESLQVNIINISEKQFKSIRIENQKLYVLTEKGINIYST
ncbi:MAG: hypothetical protein K9J13_06920 [Saprospiraceae bacterium]|nr:hypothetical protein [Saprospiraceae bacterium]